MCQRCWWGFRTGDKYRYRGSCFGTLTLSTNPTIHIHSGLNTVYSIKDRVDESTWVQFPLCLWTFHKCCEKKMLSFRSWHKHERENAVLYELSIICVRTGLTVTSHWLFCQLLPSCFICFIIRALHMSGTIFYWRVDGELWNCGVCTLKASCLSLKSLRKHCSCHNRLRVSN
jgi:hypothetical protein